MQPQSGPIQLLKSLASAGGARIAVLPITAIGSIVTARITIEATGEVAYGYVNTIALLFLLIPFADLGLGSAVTTSVASSAAKADFRTARTVVLKTAKILSAIAAALIAISVVVGANKLFTSLFGIPSSISGHANLFATAAFALFFLSLPAALGQRVLVGLGKSSLLALLGSITPAVTLLVALLMYWTGAPGFAFALTSPIAGLIFNVACAVVAHRALRARESTRGHSASEAPSARDLLLLATPAFLTALSTTALLQSARPILGQLSSPAELTNYALYSQIYLPAWSILHMMGTVLWSRFLMAENKRIVWLQSFISFSILGLLAAVAFSLLAPTIVAWMSGTTASPPPQLALAFGALLFAQAIHLPQQMFLTSRRGFWTQFLLSAGAGCLAISAGVALAPGAGAIGLLWATAGAMAAVQLAPGIILVLRATSRKEP